MTRFGPGPDRRRLAGIMLAAIAAAAILATVAFAARDDLLLGSRQSAVDGGAAATASSYAKYSGPSISADGRYVAFESYADNLSSDDNNAVENVYVRDFQTNTTTLVSRQSAADGGAGGDGGSYATSISADGRYVAFASEADNLSTVDDNTLSNLFVRDLQTNTTTLVTRQSDADGGAGANGSSDSAAISPDGRFVTFDSDADNLSAADDNSVGNIFLRDVEAGTTTLITRQSNGDGGAGANAASYDPSVSAGGRFVSFDSGADNLSTEDNNAFGNIFRRDVQTGTTTLVSRAAGAGGAVGDAESDSTSISADGRYVAFESSASNLLPGDTNATDDIYVRDMDTGAVARASGGSGPGYSYGPQMSRDGRFVSFYGQADDLSPDDNNLYSNVFVRDMQTGALTLISRQAGASGAPAEGNSDDPSVSDDGRFVVFESGADNISLDDQNGLYNVFRREFRSPPINTAAPAISGTAALGQTLTCSPGSWDNSPTFAFQWNREGTAIAGATAATYTVVADDLARALTCTVTASNGDGSAAATSAAVTPTAPAPVVVVEPLSPPPVAPALPAITSAGRASTRARGATITVDTGMRVSCPAGTVLCPVAVRAVTAAPPPVSRAAKKLLVGKRSFSVAPGKTTKVTFKLSKKGARLLRRLKRLKVTVTVVARRGTGAPVRSVRTIRLKPPRPAR